MGPEPTMTKSTVACPSARIAAAMSPAGRSLGASRAAATRPSARGRGRSPAPARRSASTSSGDLRIRSVRSTAPARLCSASGRAARKPQHLLGPHPVGQPDRADPADPTGDEGVRVLGLAPAQHLDAQPRDAGRLHGRHLQAGHDQERLAVGRQDQAGQALQREGVVARSGSAGPARE